MSNAPHKPALDLAALLSSWEIALQSDNKSPQTIRNYLHGMNLFIKWCVDNGHTPAVDRALVRGFVADILAGGAEPATARARQLAVRRFAAWCEEEGEIDADPLVGLKPPKLHTKVTNSLTADEVRLLVKACQGSGFRDRRDEAIVRLMVETGLRAGEVLNLKVSDVNLSRGLLTVVRGKGGKGRVVPFGPYTARAIDRYMRMRRTHTMADTPKLFLGDRSQALGYYGLRLALLHRAEHAGISDFHPHLLRHTAASRWLAAGGSEGGLMSIAGWSSRDMVDRYTRSTAAERAAAEARSLNLGEL